MTGVFKEAGCAYPGSAPGSRDSVVEGRLIPLHYAVEPHCVSSHSSKRIDTFTYTKPTYILSFVQHHLWFLFLCKCITFARFSKGGLFCGDTVLTNLKLVKSWVYQSLFLIQNLRPTKVEYLKYLYWYSISYIRHFANKYAGTSRTDRQHPVAS